MIMQREISNELEALLLLSLLKLLANSSGSVYKCFFPVSLHDSHNIQTRPGYLLGTTNPLNLQIQSGLQEAKTLEILTVFRGVCSRQQGTAPKRHPRRGQTTELRGLVTKKLRFRSNVLLFKPLEPDVRSVADAHQPQ